jgi:hypothetical protein
MGVPQGGSPMFFPPRWSHKGGPSWGGTQGVPFNGGPQNGVPHVGYHKGCPQSGVPQGLLTCGGSAGGFATGVRSVVTVGVPKMGPQVGSPKGCPEKGCPSGSPKRGSPIWCYTCGVSKGVSRKGLHEEGSRRSFNKGVPHG